MLFEMRSVFEWCSTFRSNNQTLVDLRVEARSVVAPLVPVLLNEVLTVVVAPGRVEVRLLVPSDFVFITPTCEYFQRPRLRSSNNFVTRTRRQL